MEHLARQRLFEVRDAFDHPVTRWIALGVAAGVVLAWLLVFALSRGGRLSPELRRELVDRLKSWLVFIPLMGAPVLLGAAWTILAVGLLSLLCYREFARATGLFREKVISLVVVLGILAITFAVADHWYGFFVALTPLTISIMAALAILADRPKGYIQRFGLGVLAFALFGTGLGHLGYFANDRYYRPILLMLLVCVEMNDIFAYCVGKTIGGRKLAPNTSPNKTLAGATGALVLTTALTAVLGHYVFRTTPLDTPARLILLGVIVSLAGQLGDLMLSSIKRDLGIKDMGAAFAGHGGLLDRFNSILLVAPAAFHYIGYYRGIGLDQPTRIMSG